MNYVYAITTLMLTDIFVKSSPEKQEKIELHKNSQLEKLYLENCINIKKEFSSIYSR
jgi:hypothetical protein